MQTHADTGVESLSSRLDGVSIAVGVCGGIGAVEVVKIIRQLRRHGARVTAFMTPDSLQFVTELSVSWACETSAIVHPSARVEHLQSYDIALIVPATLNTISKCALALCDNVVTLMVATHLGRRRPLVFVPSMHEDLKNHPLYSFHRDQLAAWGAQFLESSPAEGKIKVPLVDNIVGAVIELWGAQCPKR